VNSNYCYVGRSSVVTAVTESLFSRLITLLWIHWCMLYYFYVTCYKVIKYKKKIFKKSTSSKCLMLIRNKTKRYNENIVSLQYGHTILLVQSVQFVHTIIYLLMTYFLWWSYISHELGSVVIHVCFRDNTYDNHNIIIIVIALIYIIICNKHKRRRPRSLPSSVMKWKT